MILAGEIGATRTRLAAFETEGNRLQRVVEKTYMSQQHDGLSGILADFIKTEGIPVHSACLGVAGPVRAGRSKISNLPWVIDAKEVATQLRLNSVGLLNDLEGALLGWLPASSFCLRRRARRLCAEGRSADGIAGLPAEEVRPH